MRNIIRVLLGALYRPFDLIEDLKTRGGMLWLTFGVGICVMIGAPVLTLILIFASSAELSSELVGTFITLPFFSTLLCSIGIIATPLYLSLRPVQYISFWFVVTQITVTPLLILGSLVIIGQKSDLDEPLSLIQFVLLLLVFGIAVGKVISLMIVLHRRAEHKIDRRWLLVISLPILAVALWFTPQARNSSWLALAPLMLGIAWAQLHLEAWLWQACWSIILVRTTTVSKHTHRLSCGFPASFDQLRLLPLPGTTTMLQQHSSTSAYETASWIERLAGQPNDRWLAQRFILQLHPSPQANAILFWLSINPVGQVLLRSLEKSQRRVPGLVQSYAQLSHIIEPGAWRLVLQRNVPVLVSTPAAKDILWLPQLVANAQIILEARRWEQVQQGMTVLSQPLNEDSKPIEEMLTALREDIHHTLRSHLETPDHQMWPLRLLATATEQLTFLKSMA